jgi:hypothetical protein
MVIQINAVTKSGKIPEVRMNDKRFSKWKAEMTPGNHHAIVQASIVFSICYYYYLQVEYKNSRGSLSFSHLYLQRHKSIYVQSFDINIINVTKQIAL